MWLSLFFEMNVLVLLTCVVFFVLHEIVAHIDVCLALPNREVGVWEQHVHAYLSTIPFYLMSLIICRNWNVFMDVLTMSWVGKWSMSGANKLSVAWPTSGGIRRLSWWGDFGFRCVTRCGVGRDRVVLLASSGCSGAPARL